MHHTIVSKRMQHGLNLTTVICTGCSLVFTNPLPPRDTYERFYRDAYADYYGHITPPPEGPRLKQEPAYLTTKFNRLEQSRALAGCRLLEVGPGPGLFLWWARHRGCEVLGVEPSPEFCRALAAVGLPHLEGNLTDVRVETHGQFDIIFMAHVLEHFYDPNEALDQCRRLLTAGGILAVEVPNILKPFRSLDQYFLRYVHPTNFSSQTLAALLQKHGFQSLQVDEGHNDWRSPQNLFVVAQSEDHGAVKAFELNGEAQKVILALSSYRQAWQAGLAAKWYARSLALGVRRIVFRLGRPIKRFFLGRRTLPNPQA